jgi:hypothetical protein
MNESNATKAPIIFNNTHGNTECIQHELSTDFEQTTFSKNLKMRAHQFRSI